MSSWPLRFDGIDRLPLRETQTHAAARERPSADRVLRLSKTRPICYGSSLVQGRPAARPRGTRCRRTARGARRAPAWSAAGGEGSFRSRYSIIAARRTPRSPTGSTSGRPRWKIRNMSTVHWPIPLTWMSRSATSASGSVVELLQDERTRLDVLGEVAQEGDLRSRQPGGRPQLLRIVGRGSAAAWASGRRSARAASPGCCGRRAPTAADRRSSARARRSDRARARPGRWDDRACRDRRDR